MPRSNDSGQAAASDVPGPNVIPETPAAPTPDPALVALREELEQLLREKAEMAAKLKSANAAIAGLPAVANPSQAPIVHVNVPPEPVIVDEYYELDFEKEILDPDGDRCRTVKGVLPDHSDDKVVRFRILRGTGLHVKGTLARLSFAPDGARVAHPADGRPPLPFNPGKPGCFGIPAAPGR